MNRITDGNTAFSGETKNEKTIYSLRNLYGKYGYLPYKMSKFEEYDLYVRNKDFLLSDRIITFNDTDGKLLALKPDVTLSIIKNGDDKKGVKQKVYYNENVYRVSESTHKYKEIMQSGLECIGDIDLYDIYEVISIAAKSLSVISDSFVLEISALDILSEILSSVCNDEAFLNEAITLISNKNSHDILRLCEKYGVPSEKAENILTVISAYGKRDDVIEKLECLSSEKSLSRLKKLSKMLDNSPYSDKITIDFSVATDMRYYNGFVFKGFVDGVFEGVLAGGQYDRLMKKLGRTSGAVGFALYLDLLERLDEKTSGYDVGILLLYDENTSKFDIAKKVDEIILSGDTVSVQKAVPEKLRYREIYDMRG